jgi:hypothetical protein
VSLPRYVQIKPQLNGRASCLRVYWRRGNPDRRIRSEKKILFTTYTQIVLQYEEHDLLLANTHLKLFQDPGTLIETI